MYLLWWNIGFQICYNCLAPTLFFLTADSAIVSLTMVTMGFDQKQPTYRPYYFEACNRKHNLALLTFNCLVCSIKSSSSSLSQSGSTYVCIPYSSTSFLIYKTFTMMMLHCQSLCQAYFVACIIMWHSDVDQHFNVGSH
jgi:hypothetical protein